MSAIGIWTKSEVSGELKRDHARKMDWPYWADVARIPRKAGRKRIAFVGESAARGYFFDPEYTPAAALEELTGYEVLDLARTDLRLSAFEELLSKLPALEPDAIVLYAGNNWQLSMS
ncbi:MAG TPA: hypothetical protein VFV50_13690, partial [Bdellovibrionales bacterium]|nr:hypothetical protein [Bdellovibrionales bacterium]